MSLMYEGFQCALDVVFCPSVAIVEDIDLVQVSLILPFMHDH